MHPIDPDNPLICRITTSVSVALLVVALGLQSGCQKQTDQAADTGKLEVDELTYFFFSQDGQLESVDTVERIPTQYRGAVLVSEQIEDASRLSRKETIYYVDLFDRKPADQLRAKKRSWPQFNRLSNAANEGARFGIFVAFRAEQLAVVDPASNRRRRLQDAAGRLKETLQQRRGMDDASDVSRETTSSDSTD